MKNDVIFYSQFRKTQLKTKGDKNMKRTKQTEKMIEQVNFYLKNNKINNPFNDVAQVFMASLLAADTYKGFNFYNENGTLTTEEKCDYIQIY